MQIRQALPEIAFIAIFPTSAGFLLQTTAQRYVSAPVAAVLVSTESLFGGALAWLLLGEGLTPAGLVGCCLIFGGVMLAATTNTPPAMPPMTLPPSRARPSKVPITKIPITKIPVTLTG